MYYVTPISPPLWASVSLSVTRKLNYKAKSSWLSDLAVGGVSMVIMMMVMMMVVISIYCSMQNTWQMPGVATANPFLVFAHFFFLTTTETTQTAAPPAHSPKGREEQSPVETIVAEATRSARFTRGRRRHASSSWFPAFCTFGEISPVRHYTEMAPKSLVFSSSPFNIRSSSTSRSGRALNPSLVGNGGSEKSSHLSRPSQREGDRAET